MSRNHSWRSAFAVNLLLTSPGYPRPMPALPRLLAFAVLSIAAMPAMAVKIERIQVQGLDETMTENVRVNLSLQDAVGKVVSGRRMAYLVRVAEDETREALEPFGYYSPSITIQRSDRSAPESDTAGVAPRVEATGAAPAAREPDPNRPVSITITVRPGEPVKVRNETVAIEGDASDDRYLKEEIDAFEIESGDVQRCAAGVLEFQELILVLVRCAERMIHHFRDAQSTGVTGNVERGGDGQGAP